MKEKYGAGIFVRVVQKQWETGENCRKLVKIAEK
jgi:hypothetical protein